MRILLFFILTFCLGYGSFARAEDQSKEEEKKLTTKDQKKLDIEKKSKSFLLGTGVRQYKYSEPGLVTHEGILFDVWGEWYWESAIGNGKVYGNLLFGTLAYDGFLFDESANMSPYSASTTDIIARINSRLEFDLNKSLYLFGGFGYRYLYDRGEGAGFYTRTGNWAYLPLGAYIKNGRFLLEFEYDLIVYGSIKSNLSEAMSKYSDLTLSQKGYGLLVTTGYDITSMWSIYATYELWALEESETAISGGTYFVEPKNSSQSFELKLGYSF